MISATRATERPRRPRRAGPRPGGCARCLPLVVWLMGTPSCLAPAWSGSPQQCGSRRAGPDARRVGATARGGEIAVFGISLQNSVQKQPARVEGPEEIQGACPGCGLRGLRTSTNCRGHRGGAKPAIWIGWRTPGPKASANRRRLCHPDGIAAGPRSPVEGPGRRGPGSRDAYQSKGLVTSVPGEPPRDGRGHRRRVGTAATPAIRTDVDPVAGAPAPLPLPRAPSRPAHLAARPPPAMTLGPRVP